MTHCNLCHKSLRASQNLMWQKDGFDIIRCPYCGLIFRSKLPHSEALRQIYGNEYFFGEIKDIPGQGYLNYLQDEDSHRENAKKRLREIERYQVKGKLLDVGCAAGFFLDEARKYGWEGQGLELSQMIGRWGEEHLKLNIAIGNFQETEFQAESFDCITMWDYIEHSTDPMLDFKKSYALLKPGGILVFSTGDIGSFVAKLSGKRWHLLTPRYHNFYFTKDTITGYLHNVGFKIMAMRYQSSVYTLRYLIHKLRVVVDNRLLLLLADWLKKKSIGSLKIRLNLGDIMTVYGHKVD